MSQEKNDTKNQVLVRASWISTVGNVFLSFSKITIGILSGSLAVLSDGIDSATDVLISIVMIITSKIVSRPPDKEHVYGYEKAESIATKILSFVVFYAGIQLLITSIRAIFSTEERRLPSIIAIYITLFSIVGKLGLAYYQFNQGKKINSQMLIANAKNMRNDVLISINVLIGLFFTSVLKMPILDAVTGVVVSLFVLKTGIGIFIDSNVELMDTVKDTTVYDRIFKAVDMVPEAINPHRVRVRPLGGMYVISMDMEVSGHLSIIEGHEIAEKVETKIKELIDNVYDIRIHIEPKGVLHSPEKYGIEKDEV